MVHTPKSEQAYNEDHAYHTAQMRKQYKELAQAIADQAQAIADGTVTGPVFSQVIKLSANIATLKAWTTDDRNN